MGGKGTSVSAGPAEQELAAGSAELRDLLRPLRLDLTDLYSSVLGGGLNRYFSEAVDPNFQAGGAGGAAPAGPALFSQADLYNAMRSIDLEKDIDIPRVFGNLPEGGATLEQLKSMADMGGLSGRSKSNINQLFARLEQQGQRGGGRGTQAGDVLQPIVGSAIERSLLATDRALGELEENPVYAAQRNSPFSQQTRELLRLTGMQETAAIPSRLLESLLGAAQSTAFGTPLQTQTQSAASAAGAESGRRLQEAQMAAQADQQLLGGLTQLGMAIGMAPMTGGASLFGALGGGLAGLGL